MMRLLRTTILTLLAAPVLAAQQTPQSVRAEFRHGQSFVTWTDIASTPAPTEYRIYRSSTPITKAADLATADFVGTQAPGSYYNARAKRPFLLNEMGTPLRPGEGFVVTTAPSKRTSYYAVTAVWQGVENRSVDTTRGGTTSAAIVETPMDVRPVRQAVVGNAEEYVQFLPENANGFVQAQTNRLGRALNYQVVVDRTKAGPRPVVLVFHSRGGSWKTARVDSFVPANAIQIALDDDNDPYLTSLWFGYNEGFPGPVRGRVQDYTERRILRTLRRVLADTSLAADPKRVYAYGISFGAMAALGLGVRHPDLIAASAGAVPAFGITHSDFILTRDILQLFGTRAQNLDTNLGQRIYDVFDYGAQMASRSNSGVAPMWFTCGRADAVTGWTEKPAFFRAARWNQQPIRFYWDTRSHSTSGAWSSLEARLFQEMLDVRLDRPVPVMTTPGLDDDPGDGGRFSGDTIGTIGGYVTYDAKTVTESAAKVSFVCRLRDDASRRDHAKVASAFVDMTLRRLNLFQVGVGRVYRLRAFDTTSNALLEERFFIPNFFGRIALPKVLVTKAPRRIEIEAAPTGAARAHVGGSLAPGGLLALSAFAPAAQPTVLLLGTQPAQIPTPWGTLGMADPILIWSGLMPFNGFVGLRVNIPADNNLRGLNLLGQAWAQLRLTPTDRKVLR